MGRDRLAAALVLMSSVGSGCYQPVRTEDYRAEFAQWQQTRAKHQAKAVRGPQQGTVRDVTFEDAWRRAEALHRQGGIDAADNAALRARVRVQQQIRNPSLRLSNVKFDQLGEGEPAIDLALRFPLPMPGRAAAMQDAVRAQLRAQMAEQRDLRFARQHALERLFVDAWSARQRLRSAKRYAQAIQDRAAAVAAQLSTGTATHVEVSRRRLDAAVAQREADEVESELATIRQEVARQTGLSSSTTWRLATPHWIQAEVSVKEPVPQLEAAVAEAMEHRAQGESRRWAVTEAKANVFVAESESWPWFDFVQIGYRFESPLQPDTFEFGLSLRLPLYHQNRAAIDEARAKLLAASLRKEVWLGSVASDVEASLSALKRARRGLRRLNEGVVAAAADHRKAVQEALKANTVVPEALEQARASELKAARMLLLGRIKLVYARWALRGAIGRLVAVPATSGRPDAPVGGQP